MGNMINCIKSNINSFSPNTIYTAADNHPGLIIKNQNCIIFIYDEGGNHMAETEISIFN